MFQLCPYCMQYYVLFKGGAVPTKIINKTYAIRNAPLNYTWHRVVMHGVSLMLHLSAHFFSFPNRKEEISLFLLAVIHM